MPNPLPLSKILNPQSSWYRGDFHAHTNFSDGVHTPLELLEIARAEGLDFFAITDHNSIDAYAHFGEPDDMLIIPGNEVTTKAIGHFNVFGIQGQPDWCQSATYPDLSGEFNTFNKMMAHTAKAGLLNSINHPCLRPWAWLDNDTTLTNLHCLEIWNDPSWPDNQRDNPRAVTMWTRWLNAGYRITAIGGSDYHRPEPGPNQKKPAERLGLPSTYVYAENLSGAAILAALRQRRAYVSMGPQLKFQASTNGQHFEIGAEIGPTSAEISFQATLSSTDRNGIIQIVKNGEVIASSPVQAAGTSLAYIAQGQLTASEWYRFEAWDEVGQLLAISNPIFVGPVPRPSLHTYGDFVDGL